MPGLTSVSPSTLTAVGNELYFDNATNDGDTLEGLTVSSTTPTEIEIAGQPANAANLVNAAGTLFFSTPAELYSLASPSAAPEPIGAVAPAFETFRSNLVNIGGAVLFAGETPARGEQLWGATATAETQAASINGGDMSSYPAGLTNLGSTLVFSANTGVANDTDLLWASTGSGATELSSIAADPNSLVNVSGTAFFEAYNARLYQDELWRTDGTAAGTAKVTDGTGVIGGPVDLANGGSELDFFRFAEVGGATQEQLWEAGSTGLAHELAPLSSTSSNAYQLTAVGGDLFWVETDANGVQQLWEWNGSSLAQVSSFTSTDTSLGGLINAGGTLYFSGTDEQTGTANLWEDGPSGITQIAQSIDRQYESEFRNYVNVGSTLYFVGISGGAEQLEETSGAAPTPVSGAPTYVDDLIDLNGTLYFTDDADDIWSASGASATEVATGAGSGLEGIGAMTEADSTILFQGDSASSGEELWELNGTTPQQVADIHPGNASGYPNDFTPVGNTVFFAADDGATGNELWEAVPGAGTATTPTGTTTPVTTTTTTSAPAATTTTTTTTPRPGTGTTNTTTTPPRPPSTPVRPTSSIAAVKIGGDTAHLTVSCTDAASASCTVTLTASVTEKLRGGTLISVSKAVRPDARKSVKKAKTTKKVVVIASATGTLGSGETKTLMLKLNRTGEALLKTHHSLKAAITLTIGGVQQSEKAATFTYTKPTAKNRHRHKATKHRATKH